MADKFTRLSIDDGEEFYADKRTPANQDSIEELEDNIDAAMLGFVAFTTSASTVIPANTVNNRIVVWARVDIDVSGGTTENGDLEIGPSGGALTQRDQVLFQENSVSQKKSGLTLLASRSTADGEDFTTSVKVNVSVSANVTNKHILILGI